MAFVAYYILVCDNALHASVSAIISWSHLLSMEMHLAVLAIIPIYIAIIIFGTALLGIYLGSAIQTCIKVLKAKYPLLAKSKT